MSNSKRKKKKTFLAVYLGTPNSMKRFEKLPAKERQRRETEGIQAWHAWVKKNSKSILDVGAPLGSTKKIDRKGIKNSSNQLTAYTVVEAFSHAAAARLFKNHPHFMVFPGDSIQIMECIAIPGM